MKHRFLIATAIAATLTCLPHAYAQDAAATPAVSVSGNAALVSDYLFRGLSQSWEQPAIQGGAELATSNGFIAGVSASSVSVHSYPGGSMELDLYASYGTAINDDWSWRGGIYGYIYPGSNLSHAGLGARSLNTAEANLALSWKLLTLKYNRALTDYFGADVEQGYRGNSRGSDYLQLDATLPLGEQWSLALHAGHLRYSTTLATPLANGSHDPGYSDFGSTLKYQFAPHWSASAGVSHATNADFYRHTSSAIRVGESRDIGGTRVFVMLQGTF